MRFLPLFLSLFLIPSGANALDTAYQTLLKQITPEQAEEISASVPVPAEAADVKALDDSARYWLTASASDSKERTALLEMGLDIIEIGKDTVSGFAGADTVQAVSAKGLAKKFRAIGEDEGRDFPAKDAAYHNYAETTALLKEMSSKNSDIASVFSVGKTTEGRDIWCLRLNSSVKGNGKSTKPGAFFLGNHHAREHISNEVPLLFAAWLLDNRKDPEIKKYLDTLDIFILPMLNPDGVEYDIKGGRYQMYRKNMSKNSDGSFGTDLNRNYDFLWCKYGSSHTPRSDTFCGKAAFSEPESQAMRKFFGDHTNIKTHISYHSYGQMILYPYGGTYDEIDSEQDKKAFIRIGDEMAKMTGYRNMKSSDLYTSSGDSCDWVYEQHKVLAFTFELDGNGFYPSASQIDSIVSKNIKAAKYLLSQTANPYK